MHPVLLIDEVLRIIFDHVDHHPSPPSDLKAFYRLATVCRAWKDPALDYLWSSLVSVDPLLALLPRVSDAPSYIPSDALARFHAYSSRVRNVGQSVGSVPVLKLGPNITHAIAKGNIVLPSLRSVHLVFQDPTRQDFPLDLYLSRSLQCVSVDVGFRASKETDGLRESLHVYLDAVARVSTNLQHLCLRGRLSDRVVNSVACMRELRSLSICGGSQLMPRTLSSIACFPNLEDLRLQLNCPSISDLAEGLGSASSDTALFPSLRALRIRVPPAAAEVFFAHVPQGRLHTVHLESDLKPRSVDSWTPALAILAERAHSSLTDFSFDALTSFCEGFDHALPPKLHITLATLAPLARLAHLRRFALDASVPPDLADADLATLASWWPKIEELVLWSRPVDAFDRPAYFTAAQTRATTPSSLTVLARRCPRLRRLSLPTDVAVLPPPAHPPLVLPSQTALARLTIGCVRTGKTIDPAGLAECIYHAFPALEELEFDCGDETSWADVLERYFGLGGHAAPI
ncbi:hypothetical protein F5148DRAFT_1017090 [Russula earlei]|uniref:Uncharacterized protein n=1 Tax=Russula earlei TaxID=71964 RepID=A0ACC0U242_9AGAM|nr:hypothetical protein F5148DRAFT_1017090 [Russula earlei]